MPSLCAGALPPGIAIDALNNEDRVRIVLGPFFDGPSGYVFAVKPSSARYDGLITPGGESDNPDWDGVWDATTRRSDSGWSGEVLIPVQTRNFKADLREWRFNVRRRIHAQMSWTLTQMPTMLT